MCLAYENTVKKYKAEGRKEGMLEGRLEGKLEMVLGLYALNIPIATIAKAAKVSVEQVQQWIAENKDNVLV